MTDRFPWTVTTYPADHSLMAECLRPGCGGVRYLPREYLLKKLGDVPLLDVERRARCIEPGCPGRMELAWVPKSRPPEATQAPASHAADLAAFADRMGGGRTNGR